MSLSRLILIAMPFLFLTACSPNSGWLEPSFNKPLSVAVLVMENQSNDLRVADEFRLMFTYSLQDRGYTTARLIDVDAKLHSMGVVDGGQIQRYTMAQYCETMGTEAVVVGVIEKASQKTLGVYNSNEFRVRMQMFRGSTLIWSDTTEQSERSAAISLTAAANQAIDRTMDRSLRKLRGHPLQNVMEYSIFYLQRKFPGKQVEITGWEALETK